MATMRPTYSPISLIASISKFFSQISRTLIVPKVVDLPMDQLLIGTGITVQLRI
ncbi:unnamed protein product [Oppiella nova]|uniref:Uncharacterized protein n=1 Tax=Oppiella nova TaxID=334625 RepID=A0A7R9MU29_9ACAR|nr:unnamed protein product [Oppiella nova]CAG2183658.1 unnamed protein product [Oppiella nova]